MRWSSCLQHLSRHCLLLVFMVWSTLPWRTTFSPCTTALKSLWLTPFWSCLRQCSFYNIHGGYSKCFSCVGLCTVLIWMVMCWQRSSLLHLHLTVPAARAVILECCCLCIVLWSCLMCTDEAAELTEGKAIFLCKKKSSEPQLRNTQSLYHCVGWRVGDRPLGEADFSKVIVQKILLLPLWDWMPTANLFCVFLSVCDFQECILDR